jgi:hypothetical protein
MLKVSQCAYLLDDGFPPLSKIFITTMMNPPSPSMVPLLFLISVYLDNEWPSSQEESLLNFLTDYILGKLGISCTSLSEFLDLMHKANLHESQVDLVAFLKENIPRMTEHRYALESFLKEISILIVPSKIDTPKTVYSTLT